MSPEGVVFLNPVELVTLDASAMTTLGLFCSAANVGFAADDLVEDFVVCLSSVEAAWATGEFERLVRQSELLVGLSEALGLVQCASIARQLNALVHARDDVALASVTARVVRVGEASLASVFDFAYHRV